MAIFKDILARFPRGGLSYVFAYGSGVKQQIGYEEVAKQKNNIIDLIFCVRDPLGWHAENLDRQESHYSLLRLLGPRFIMNYQEHLGARVYFNTLVPLHDIHVTIKYGVISREHLLDDLQNWRYLYLAGRLQKPVFELVATNGDDELKEALACNLLSAFQVALLLLPERFTAYQLFHTISSLSYKGDFRMIFGENKHKVRNIVLAQEKDFLNLYSPVLQKLTDYVGADFNAKEVGTGNTITQFEQDKSSKAKIHHLRNVPNELQKRIVRNSAFKGDYMNIVPHLADSHNLLELVQTSVNDIVWRSSIAQSIKNIASAGFFKSLLYSYRKALKTFS
ncbi:phosphatidate cytidylyltransferase, mitochondrial [Anastrepha ludens]|uniref:phosphatidate cytidylyltransferase, mitochondrial n=1 Tax=Anastrepha ludens TaxID=28586 RepID=UPI0023AEBC70|nr:phosphatidate cytidylyltransferase, mitochondrial [Anastrepha ludens]